ncbi:MAG: hypothetical protein PHY93_08450 [Bacteriovorax sp.]|nr:hypothetical protein [Bacteriovorax sp.]
MFMKILFLGSTVVFLSSCLKQTESITPIAQPQTLAQLQREALMNTANLAGNAELSNNAKASLESGSDPSIFYLNLKYNINNIDVFEAANIPNSFEQIGHSFLSTIAKLVLSINGPRQIDLTPINLSMPDLNLDLSVIKSIKIKRIFLQYNKEMDSSSDFAADFSFIDTLELAREVTVPKVGTVDTLLFSYRKIRNLCLSKCIQFDIVSDNILDLLRPNTTLKLKPALTISKLPAVTDLKLDGVIEMQIGLKLPF